MAMNDEWKETTLDSFFFQARFYNSSNSNNNKLYSSKDWETVLHF